MSFGKLIVVALITVSLAGCNYSFNVNSTSGVPGSGVSATETRDVSDFQKVSIEGFGQVNIVVGDEDALSITGDDNLLELIGSTVENGMLTIRPTESINPKSDMVFEISISQLTAVSLSGAANFDIQNATGDSLEIEINGSGNLKASGNIATLAVEVNGASRIDLQQLEAEDATIELNGAASGVVFASKSIDAEINGVGKITVHGNPQDVKKEINGLGRLNVVD